MQKKQLRCTANCSTLSNIEKKSLFRKFFKNQCTNKQQVTVIKTTFLVSKKVIIEKTGKNSLK